MRWQQNIDKTGSSLKPKPLQWSTRSYVNWPSDFSGLISFLSVLVQSSPLPFYYSLNTSGTFLPQGFHQSRLAIIRLLQCRRLLQCKGNYKGWLWPREAHLPTWCLNSKCNSRPDPVSYALLVWLGGGQMRLRKSLCSCHFESVIAKGYVSSKKTDPLKDQA